MLVEEQGTELVEVGDGRRVAVSGFGDPDGLPCLYFHMTNSSRLEAAFYDGAAGEHGVRLISLDRPGVGRSDPHPGRAFSDWADDAAEVADALGVDRFVVAGASGGGPHALACASRRPDRVSAVVVINTVMPGDDPELLRDFAMQDRLPISLARRAPWLLERVFVPAFARVLGPERLSDPRQRQRLFRRFPAVDRELLSDPGRVKLFIGSLEEGLRQGPQAASQDYLQFWRGSWGFDPYALPVPVEIFVGEEDMSSRFAARLADRNERARLHRFPGGHYGFLADRATNEACATIAAAGAPA